MDIYNYMYIYIIIIIIVIKIIITIIIIISIITIIITIIIITIIIINHIIVIYTVCLHQPSPATKSVQPLELSQSWTPPLHGPHGRPGSEETNRWRPPGIEMRFRDFHGDFS